MSKEGGQAVKGGGKSHNNGLLSGVIWESLSQSSPSRCVNTLHSGKTGQTVIRETAKSHAWTHVPDLDAEAADLKATSTALPSAEATICCFSSAHARPQSPLSSRPELCTWTATLSCTLPLSQDQRTWKACPSPLLGLGIIHPALLPQSGSAAHLGTS